MNRIIVSDEKKDIISSLIKIGFDIIFSEKLEELLPFESKHADIQCLKINDIFFVARNCNYLIEQLKKIGVKVVITEAELDKNYPENVLLNAAFIKNKLYCKAAALDINVKNYCFENDIAIIDVKQGYTKCSTAIIEDCFITSDIGIYSKLTENGVEGLLIKSGDIELPGTDYGFIGGCCFYYNNTAYFTGDIFKHPDGNRIKTFLEERKIKIEILSKDKLYDIGGFIIV